MQQGRRDGSYLSDQLRPREQRRNQDLSWAVDDLMRDHQDNQQRPSEADFRRQP